MVVDNSYSLIYFSISLLFLFIAYRFLRTRPKNLLPSPGFPIPIMGHMNLLNRQPLHRYLHGLGSGSPIMWLKLGSRPVVLVSSLPVAHECFTGNNDVSLANRPGLMVGKYIGYNHTTIIDTSHGEHWRNLRRIAAVEIFSARRLDQFADIRKDEVKLMLLRLSNNASKKVELRELFQDLTFNNMMRMIAGKRYYGNVVEDREDAAEFKEIMTDVMANAGVSNSADFLPILNWINGGKFEKKLISLSQRLDKFLQKLIDERRNRDKSQDGDSNNTMIDHLLFLHQSQPEYYSDQIIKGFIQTMLLAGTDTAAVTLEWAMCNLLNHPHMINKARYEIEHQIGQDQIPRLLEESDLPKLHYLQDIISETHRLHPSAPLLLPHNSSRDLTLAGYHIPENTMLIVNAWAIHRDPRVWDDPTSFKPERFESCNDHHNKLIPFGMGRRACPGAGMAKRVIGLSLGSLIQCFDWGKCGFIDMMEGAGVTMPMLIPLQANCRPRPVVSKLGLA